MNIFRRFWNWLTDHEVFEWAEPGAKAPTAADMAESRAERRS